MRRNFSLQSWIAALTNSCVVVDAAELHADADGNLRHMKSRFPLRPIYRIRSLSAVRVALSKIMRHTDSPSENVKSAPTIRCFVEALEGPRYGRPSDRFGPPTALFSPELALLKYDLEHLEAFTPDSMGAKYAFDLIETSTNFFEKGSERRITVRPILRGLLVGESQWRAPITDGPNGTRLEETFAYPIIEIMDELGLEGDPFLRGLVAYSRALAQEKVWSPPCLFHSPPIPPTVSSIS